MRADWAPVAELDIDKLRRRDREAHGGIVVPRGAPTPPERGWFDPGELWQCACAPWCRDDDCRPLCCCEGWPPPAAWPPSMRNWHA